MTKDIKQAKNITPLAPKLASKDVKPDAPHSNQMEQTVLAAILHYPQYISRLVASINDKNIFHLEAHKTIYDAMCRVSNDNKCVDINTLSQQLNGGGKLEQCGGLGYLDSIYFDYQRRKPETSDSDFDGYVKTLKDFYGRWQLIKAAKRMDTLAHDMDKPAENTLTNAQTYLADVAEFVVEGVFTPLSVDVMQHANDMEVGNENAQIIKTGVDCLDNKVRGLYRGKYHTIVAFTNNGKTALGASIAYNVFNSGLKVAYINTADGTKSDVLSRLIAMKAGISYSNVMTNSVEIGTDSYSRYFDAVSGMFKHDNLYNQSEHMMTIDKIKSLVRTYVHNGGLDLVFIDYAQMIGIAPDSKQAKYTKVNQMEYISHELAGIGIRHNVAVLAAAQAKQSSEGRMPTVGDVRYSNSFAQDADLSLTVFKRGLYEVTTEGKENQIEIKSAKNKTNGWFGTMFANIHPLSTYVTG